MIWTIVSRLLQALSEDENAGVMKDRGHEEFAQRLNVSVELAAQAAVLAEEANLIRGSVFLPIDQLEGPGVADMSQATLTLRGYAFLGKLNR